LLTDGLELAESLLIIFLNYTCEKLI
jgi:hypothetical protein